MALTDRSPGLDTPVATSCLGRAARSTTISGSARASPLGREATALTLAHALGPLGLDAVTLTVLARNPRAVRAYERAGFTETVRYTEDGEEWVEMEAVSR